MKRFVTLMSLFFALVLTSPAHAWEYTKDEQHPDGANSLNELNKDGDYFVVKGADLHNLGADLIGKKIRFKGYVSSIDKFPARKILLLSEDKTYFVIMPYGKKLGNVPDDLRNRIEKNGIRAAGGFLKKYEGDKLTLYCTLEMLVKEGGLTGNALKYKSCIVKPVQKWTTGWN